MRVDPPPPFRDAPAAAIAAVIAETARRFREAGVDVVLADGLSAFWAVAAAERAGLPAVWRQSGAETWQSLFSRLTEEVGPIACRAHVAAYQVLYSTATMCQNGSRLAARRNADVARPALPLAPLREALGAHDRNRDRVRLGIQNDEVLVLVVGDLDDGVLHPDVIDACGLLAGDVQRRTRIVVLPAAGGVASEALAAAVAALPAGLAGRIMVADPAYDRLAYLAAADLAVCTGPVETAWRGLAEAMAAGLPLLVARWPSAHEVVEEEVNALLYAPGDPAALARRLALLVDDAGWRRALGGRSLAVLESRPSFNRLVATYARRLREAANLAVGDDEPAGAG